MDEVICSVAEAHPEEARFLRANLARLTSAAGVIRESPSIATSWKSHLQPQGLGEPLIDLLCRVPDWDLELHIPTKAVLGQAYLVAKINFFKALGYALDTTGGDPRLSERVHVELAQSIYSKLAEELFVSIVTDPSGKRDVKKSAAKLLFRIWEDRLGSEVDDFAPVLEAVWEARNKVRPVLGTMRGTQEFFRLIAEVRDDRFLSYFEGAVVPERMGLETDSSWLIDLHMKSSDAGYNSPGDFIEAGKFKCAIAQVASDNLAGGWGFTTYDVPWIPFAVLGGSAFTILVLLMIILKRRDPV